MLVRCRLLVGNTRLATITSMLRCIGSGWFSPRDVASAYKDTATCMALQKSQPAQFGMCRSVCFKLSVQYVLVSSLAKSHLQDFWLLTYERDYPLLEIALMIPTSVDRTLHSLHMIARMLQSSRQALKLTRRLSGPLLRAQCNEVDVKFFNFTYVRGRGGSNVCMSN